MGGAALAPKHGLAGKPEESLPYLDRALALQPGYAGAEYNYGLILTDLGRRAEAIEQFRAALRLDPGYLRTRTDLRPMFESLGLTRPGR